MKLEVLPSTGTAVRSDFEKLRWGPPEADSDVDASNDAWLTQVGKVSPAAIDLARIATAAFLADRRQKRGVGFSRTLALHVQLVNSSTWKSLIPQIESLLSWISNDDWRISVSDDGLDIPTDVAGSTSHYEKVALFSGGLDSFSGAVLNPDSTLFVSHSDNTIVKGSQNRAWEWLAKRSLVDGHRLGVRLAESEGKRERSTRTRSLLFYALAAAVADAHGVTHVEVPENGFTSINVPLGNDRGGVLSTRSTHPWTMHRVRSLLGDVGINVDLVNPYELLTKGELIRSAAQECGDFNDGLSVTLSCAKLNGQYLGGNPSHNCGLCIACLIRRGGVLASGLNDTTPYLANTLKGERLAKLSRYRRNDIQAVRAGLSRQIDEFALLGLSPFPDDYDLEGGTNLVRRGFAELAAVLETL